MLFIYMLSAPDFQRWQLTADAIPVMGNAGPLTGESMERISSTRDEIQLVLAAFAQGASFWMAPPQGRVCSARGRSRISKRQSFSGPACVLQGRRCDIGSR